MYTRLPSELTRAILGSVATGAAAVIAPVAGLMATIELAYCVSALHAGAINCPEGSHARSRAARLTAMRFIVPDAAGVIVNAREPVLELPTAFDTVRRDVPAVVSAEAGIVACSAVLLVKVVSSATPFKTTEEPDSKIASSDAHGHSGRTSDSRLRVDGRERWQWVHAGTAGEVRSGSRGHKASIQQVNGAGLGWLIPPGRQHRERQAGVAPPNEVNRIPRDTIDRHCVDKLVGLRIEGEDGDA